MADPCLPLGVSQELDVGQPHPVDLHLVGPKDTCRWLKIGNPRSGHHIVLVNTVTADTQAADQLSVDVDRSTSRKEHDAVLVGDISNVVEVGPGEEGVVAKHRSVGGIDRGIEGTDRGRPGGSIEARRRIDGVVVEDRKRPLGHHQSG